MLLRQKLSECAKKSSFLKRTKRFCKFQQREIMFDLFYETTKMLVGCFLYLKACLCPLIFLIRCASEAKTIGMCQNSSYKKLWLYDEITSGKMPLLKVPKEVFSQFFSLIQHIYCSIDNTYSSKICIHIKPRTSNLCTCVLS
jgi:hypothetical protein